MSNSRPIMDELDIMMLQDDLISKEMEKIDSDIEAMLKHGGLNESTSVLEEYEDIDYSLVDSLEPLDASMQDIVDDEVDEIITVNDIIDDEEGDLIDQMIGL